MSSISYSLYPELYDIVTVNRYRRFVRNISKIKEKKSFDVFVFNAISAIADILTTETNDALSVDELDIILSDFAHVDSLLRMPGFRSKRGILVTTLILLLEIHGHLSHSGTIMDPLELTDKEGASICERSGILLLHMKWGYR